METNNITISLLVRALQDEKLEDEQRALLVHYQHILLSLFEQIGNPTIKHIAEIISLAITDNKDQYNVIMNHYLKFLNKQLIIESYHIEGLVDILILASQAGWVTLSHGEQILTLLLNKNKNVLLDPTNKNTEERYQCLSLWQQVLFVMTEAGIEISKGQKEILKGNFKKYKETFKSKEGSDELGLSLMMLAKQSLLHVKDDRAPLWQRAGLKALSAVKNLSLSAAALGVIPITFGLSSLGAIAPTIGAIGNIAELINEVYQHIRDKRNIKEWYQAFLKWRSLFIISIYYKEDVAFKALVKGFIDMKDKSLKTILALGLADLLTGILRGYAGEDYKIYHEQCYELIKDCFYTLDNIPLHAKLFADLMGLMSSSVANMGAVGLCIEFILRKESEFKEWPLTSEMIKGIQLFYLTLEKFKQETKVPEELKKWRNFQEIVISRLATGYVKENNVRGLHALCELAFDERTSDKKPLEDAMMIFRSQGNESKEKVKKAEMDAQQKLRQEAASPSLMLVVWMSLSSEKKERLAEIFKKYGIDIEIKVPSNPNKRYLFGKVGALITGVVVAETGIQIHDYPTDEVGLRAFKMLLDHKKEQEKSGKEAETKEKMELAQEIGFAFMGHYVEGIEQGLNETLVKEAVRLAETYLQGSMKKSTFESKKDNSASSSSPDSSSKGATLPTPPITLPVSEVNLSKQEGGNESIIYYEKNGNRYIVKINYDDLSKTEAQQLQGLLKGPDGMEAANQKGESKKDEDDDYIIEISFSSEKSAKKLVEKGRKLIQDIQDLQPLSDRGSTPKP